MTKTHKKRYRAPAALLCLCMLLATLGSAFPLPAAAQAATPETVQTAPEAAPTPAPETEPQPSPPAAYAAGVQATPETEPPAPTPVPSTAETAPATPETSQATPEAVPVTPEVFPTTPETAAGEEKEGAATPETAPLTVQAPVPIRSVPQTEIYVPDAPADRADALSVPTVAEAVEQLADGGTLWLTADAQTDTVALTGGKPVTLRSWGGGAYTLSKTGRGANLLALSDGAALTLENVVLDAAGAAGRTVTVQSGAALALGEGAVLRNNKSGGAVFLDGAALTVDGGSIQNNTAAGAAGTKEYPAAGNWKTAGTRYIYNETDGEGPGLGGAVLMVNGSTLTVTGGDISGNTALCGGAVYAWDAGAITLDGGTFADNQAQAAGDIPAAGGALCVDGGGRARVTVDGAVFTGNSAEQGGAICFGIEAGSVDFTVTAGTFTGNESAGHGSVLYAEAADCVTDVSGADTVFSGNRAGGSGGLYLDRYPQGERSARAAVNIHDGVRFENNRAQRGACLYITENDAVSSCRISGAGFTGNEASAWGGALYCRVSGAQITLENSTFQRNKANEGAGGVLYHTVGTDDVYTVKNCTFEENASDRQYGEGGGFCIKGKNIDLTVAGGRFAHNTAWDNGGAFSVYLDGGSVTVDGTEFTGNASGSSGGAFIAFIADAAVTVTGGAQFAENTADVNAGAFSVRRYARDRCGTVELLECDVHDNVCNANFANYTQADLEPTKHYNTGGIYIGENITCHMYDALVTGNYVAGGYRGNTVGSGIGLCPNAQVYLLPEHGAAVYGNGLPGTDTMDILAVPYDYPVITHETPARLYISAVTPDGRACNWTGLDNAKARAGAYDWTNARNGVAAASAGGYAGEQDLDPVGFKANLGGAGVRTAAAANGPQQYKVRIVNNHTKSALYAGGGVMVNGTVIAGEFSVSVHKIVTVNGATAARQSALQTQQPFRFRFSIVDTGAGGGASDLTAPSAPVQYSTDKGQSGSVTFTRGTTTLVQGQDGYEGAGGIFPSISGEFTIQGEDTLTFGKITGGDIGIDIDDDVGRYFFLLEEIGDGGATRTTVTPPDNAGNADPGDRVFAFTCENVFDCGTLELSKTVTGAMGETDRLWDFTVTLQTNSGGPALSGTFPAELWEDGEKSTYTGPLGGLTFTNGAAQVAFDTEGQTTVQLADGQTLKILDLPAGTVYTVTEREADQYGYTTTPQGADGTIPAGGAARAAFTNARQTAPTGSLTVTKSVTGGGDRQQDFHFTVTFTPKSRLGGAKVFKNGQPAQGLTITDGRLAFTLKDGESLTVTDLPVGTGYTVTEAEANTGGYTTTVTDNDGAADGSGTVAESPAGQVQFVNARPTPPPEPTPAPTPEPGPDPTPTPAPRPTPAPTPGPGGPGHLPPTGDDSPLLLWTALLAAALAGLLATGLAWWKQRH